MKKVKIYLDNTVLPSWLKEFKKNNLKKIDIVYFNYEFNKKNTSKYLKKNAKRVNSTSVIRYNESYITYNDDIPYNSDLSEKINDIEKIIGKNNFNDIRHIDTAFKNRCDCFITPDKDDFIKKGKREKLEKLLGIKIFFRDEKENFHEYIKTIITP